MEVAISKVSWVAAWFSEAACRVISNVREATAASNKRCSCPHIGFDIVNDDECPHCGYNPLGEAW